MDHQILFTKNENGVRTLILNRPECRNAFNYALAEALEGAVHAAAQDESVKVLVIRGANQAFSAGGDLRFFKENLDQSEVGFKKISAHLNETILQMIAMPKVVIAALQGPAYAAGFGVAMACDLVVASETSTLSPSFINIALSPNAGTTFFLPRILGSRLALEALLRGRVFSAQEAEKWGLINYCWPEAQFEIELKKLTDELIARPTRSLARIKKLQLASFTSNLHDQLELEREEIAASSLGEDFKEGVTAFIEKRRPRFSGK